MQGATELFLSKAREKSALAALKSHRASYVGVQEAKSLTLGLAAIGWLIHRDGAGNIDGILASDEYAGLVEDDLAILAPFVKRGSSIVFNYISGFPTRPRYASFDGKRVTVRALTKREMSAAGAEKLLAAPDFEPEDPHAKPTPKRPSSDKVPAKRTPYRASTNFSPGEWLEHPKFGAGLVIATLDGSRIRVGFSDDERVLVHCRG